MKLYTFAQAPNPRRVHVYLAEKGIDVPLELAWMTVADFAGFVDAQRDAAVAYRDRDRWLRMSILNSAASGRFSSDRTISEYNDEIWKLQSVHPERADPNLQLPASKQA